MRRLHGSPLKSEFGRILPGVGIALSVLGVLVLLFAVTAASPSTGRAEKDKVLICHYDQNEQGPNAGPHTIEVDAHAVDNHLTNHTKNRGWMGDDYLGACEVETATPTATGTAPATSTPTGKPPATATATSTATAPATSTATGTAPPTATSTATELATSTATATGIPFAVVTPTLVQEVLGVAASPPPVSEVQALARAGSGGADAPVNPGLIALGLAMIVSGGVLLAISRRRLPQEG